MHSSIQDIINIQNAALDALSDGRITTTTANKIIKESRRALAAARTDLAGRIAASKNAALVERAELLGARQERFELR